MSSIPLSNFTVRATTGTNEIPSLGNVFVESPGGSGGGAGGGNQKRAIVFVILSLLLMLLPGCSNASQQLIENQTPPVRAINGGTATLNITVCTTPSSVEATQRMIVALIFELQHAGVVVVGNNGTALLSINFCPNAV